MPKRPSADVTAVDLFCGVGGLSLGLVQAGFRLIGAADLDDGVLQTYKVNFPGVNVARCDLFSRSGNDLRSELKIRRRSIDLLVGGPPCQGFSFGGNQLKRDPRNDGVLAFARLVTELRPRYFVMENVRGFLSKRHEAKRKRFASILRQGGYELRHPIQALNAADYGVPQRRLRVFALGCREGDKTPDYPVPLSDGRPNVRDAIGDLVTVDRYQRDVDVDEYDGPLDEPSEFARSLRLGRQGEKLKRLSGCLRTRHSSDVRSRFRATPPGGQEQISRFFRLAWGSISPTLRAGTGPDHGSYTAPRPIHPAKARCITVREAARLHSFPDWFAFTGTRWHGFREIGNSVPPFLAHAVLAPFYDALIES
jgi:DNA (cytosine-5)-methyltransferase 1